MDGQIPQPENQTVTTIIAKQPFDPIKSAIFVPIITLLLGFALGFMAKSILPLNKAQTTSIPKTTIPLTSKPTIDESKSPIGFAILEDPMVYQWRGSVEGLLVEKTANSITLTKDGNKLTIPVDPKETLFFDPRIGKKDQGIQSTTVDKIPIGSYLLGEFFTTPIPGDRNKIAGVSFTVEVEKSK